MSTSTKEGKASIITAAEMREKLFQDTEKRVQDALNDFNNKMSSDPEVLRRRFLDMSVCASIAHRFMFELSRPPTSYECRTLCRSAYSDVSDTFKIRISF
jgi:hypothetical protein